MVIPENTVPESTSGVSWALGIPKKKKRSSKAVFVWLRHYAFTYFAKEQNMSNMYVCISLYIYTVFFWPKALVK